MASSKDSPISTASIIFLILLALGILLPFGMNAIWAAGGPELFYWGTRGLLDLEKLTVGLALIALPTIAMLSSKKDDRYAISWKRYLLAITLGIMAIALGIHDMRILVRRWLRECATIVECIQ
jgi:hypothetical protein